MDNPKKQLRRRIIDERDKLTYDQIVEKSRSVAENFWDLDIYQRADTIMYFISFGSEIDTRPIIDKSLMEGKTVLVPRPIKEEKKMIASCLLNWDEDLTAGVYGILEPLPEKTRPVEPETIDLMVVPGVAFDPRGNRLGYGGGYYDRFFNLLRRDTPLVAIAFEMQIVDDVPVESWDRKVDILITEERVIYF